MLVKSTFLLVTFSITWLFKKVTYFKLLTVIYGQYILCKWS